MHGVLRNARLIHFAILFGLVFLSLLVLTPFVPSPDGPSELESTFLLVAAAVTLSTAVPAPFLAARISPKPAPQDLETLSPAQRGANAQRWVTGKILTAALYEGAGLLWTVFAFLTDNHQFLIGSGFCALLILLSFPTRDQLEERVGDLDRLDRPL